MLEFNFDAVKVLQDKQHLYSDNDEEAVIEACKNLLVALFILSVVLEEKEVNKTVNILYNEAKFFAEITKGFK